MTKTIDAFASVSPSVFETDGDPVCVHTHQIRQLIAAARHSPSGRARLILHYGRDDMLHEMVIALPANSCDHPHINYKSGKSFLALSGQFAVLHCSDDGAVITPIILSAGEWPGARMVRLRRAAWHTIIPLAGDTVFLETILGPFTGNHFASWFPGDEEQDRRIAMVEKFREIATRQAAVQNDP